MLAEDFVDIDIEVLSDIQNAEMRIAMRVEDFAPILLEKLGASPQESVPASAALRPAGANHHQTGKYQCQQGIRKWIQ